MTPAAAASLVRQLATEVMGWERTSKGWEAQIGPIHSTRRADWNPLTDANAMLECVCAAAVPLSVAIYSASGKCQASAWRTIEDCVQEMGSRTPAAICEAVCLALARATGWHEPEEVDRAEV